MMKRLVGLAWVFAAVGFAACGGTAFTSGTDVGDGGGGGSGSTGGGGSGGSSGSTSSSGVGSGSSSGVGSSSSSGVASSSSSGASSSSSSGVASSSSSGASSSGMGTSSGISSGVSGDAGQSDAVAPPASCPLSAPDPSGACKAALAGVTCEWGTGSVPECDQVATCTSGKWVFQTAGSACAPESACPATAPTDGAKCLATLAGTYCDYDYGSTTTLYRCACELDSMVSGDVTTWQCQDPGGTCPMPRPRLGTACQSSANQLVCDYGSCGIPGGNSETCTEDLWTQVTSACTAGPSGG